MKELTFSTALRAEIDAVVARYEALVMAQQETLSALRKRDMEALVRELEEAHADRDRLRARDREHVAELASLRARSEELDRLLGEAQGRLRSLEAEAHTAGETAKALEEQFAAEMGFVSSSERIEGSLLADAIKGAIGRDLDRSPASYAALKARGLEVVLIAAFRERGNSVLSAPLLQSELRALPTIAAAAGCELISPTAGQRFSSSAMDKASTVSAPAEEGNVLECVMPGARRIGTSGAVVLPRVVVASG